LKESDQETNSEHTTGRMANTVPKRGASERPNFRKKVQAQHGHLGRCQQPCARQG